MHARAFSNDVEYDLSVSNIIRYKGAEMEILSADNMKISYKVLKNFNWAKPKFDHEHCF